MVRQSKKRSSRKQKSSNTNGLPDDLVPNIPSKTFPAGYRRDSKVNFHLRKYVYGVPVKELVKEIKKQMRLCKRRHGKDIRGAYVKMGDCREKWAECMKPNPNPFYTF